MSAPMDSPMSGPGEGPSGPPTQAIPPVTRDGRGSTSDDSDCEPQCINQFYLSFKGARSIPSKKLKLADPNKVNELGQRLDALETTLRNQQQAIRDLQAAVQRLTLQSQAGARGESRAPARSEAAPGPAVPVATNTASSPPAPPPSPVPPSGNGTGAPLGSFPFAGATTLTPDPTDTNPPGFLPEPPSTGSSGGPPAGPGTSSNSA
ncbi:putative ORF-X [Gammapolyomavirus lonmaja]|uniref:Putative ORF-X n=1 Tax=Gammapolyomavirus lonmaja TaxID=2169904 RepID=A0A1D8BJ51_9POLY|nr:putative ORF-X [Gammapolyomavirus lonmaja]AOS58349.1 putative ORF-X [Gammapolyomavirus lonmaja]